MRSLVWRYVSAMHRKIEDSPVTEDDINEVKMEISAMRYELLEVFEKNGMDVSCASRKDKSERHVSSARPSLMTFFLIIYFNSCPCKEDEGLGKTINERFPRCSSRSSRC